ncbi:hypothetical protein QQX98_012688 [Neonectria punicea]|uniref:Uncharacterized protein n=1 Tax=Neonectria punicea TaxID=979145 RepID=A0ABR1GI75_9HYPO
MSLITPQASRESTPALDATKTATQREQELLKELTTLRAQKAEEEEESNKNRLLKENNIDNTPPANPPGTEPANTPVTAPITEPVAPITAPVTAPVTAPEPNDSNDNFEIKIHDKPVPLTEPEKDFLVDHCETYFPHINGLDEKGKSIIFNILCPNFKAYHEDRHVFQLIFYAEFVLQTMDPAAAATAISRFVMEPPAWNFMSWGGKFDADIVNGRMKKAQERLDEYQTGIAYIHKSKVLSSAEIDFIRSNEFKTYFPGLLGLDDAPKIWMYKTCNEFKENNPRRDLFEYLLFAEYSLLSEKPPLYRGDAIAKFIKSPKALDAFDWGNVNQDAVKVWEGRMSAAREALAKFRANSKESSDSEAALYTSDSEAALYNSEERRAIRAQFYGKGDAEANRIVIKDPETGKDVISEILG